VKASVLRVLAVVAALFAAIALGAPAQAASSGNPYQRGPDPTVASVTAETGPFATATVTVPSGFLFTQGFNDGTIYYPTDTGQGAYGAVVIMPGFFATQSSISWYGPRLASQGFVVMTLDSNFLFDFPGDRSSQQLAAVDYLTTQSTVRNEVDPNRLAVMGWSMGGGGTLESAANQPSLKAAIALAPWDLNNVAAQITVPTLIFGADGDTVASVSAFAQPFYTSLAQDRDKALVVLKNADHFTFASPSTPVAEYSIAWLKRFVDNDTRYDQFLCPAPSADPGVASFQDTCPL
jgi:dienelactone hydrolase